MARSFTTYLPGTFHLEPGTFADYRALSRFHYRAGPPATVAGVWRIRYINSNQSTHNQLAAVGVLSWPVPCCRERNRAFGLHGLRYGQRLAFANEQLRTISRVIVHPVFRATGLAVRLVQCLCEHCPTRHVEALATMGWVHPFFERAGMTRLNPDRPGRPVYYHFDRDPPAAGGNEFHPPGASSLIAHPSAWPANAPSLPAAQTHLTGDGSIADFGLQIFGLKNVDLQSAIKPPRVK
jgi:hypothetical protein